MANPLTIYIDRLKAGATFDISEVVGPECLELQEEDEVSSHAPITISGRAYIAEEFLILTLNIQAELEMPCALCSETFSYPLHLKDVLHEEPIKNIKHGVYNYAPVIREAVLLEIPFYPQCGGKVCLKRKEFEKYLKKETKEEEYHPFQGL